MVKNRTVARLATVFLWEKYNSDRLFILIIDTRRVYFDEFIISNFSDILHLISITPQRQYVHNHSTKPTQNGSNDIMPRKISGTEFNQKLRINRRNVEDTLHFLAEGVSEFVLPGFVLPKGYRLVKSRTKDQYRLIAEGEKPETVYLVELRFRRDIVIGKTTCTQVKVWRSSAYNHVEIIKDLPRQFFINLLNSYSIMVTDEEQTDAGQRFWETMISWAFSQNYFVYASNGEEEERSLARIANMEDFYLNWIDVYWGKDKDIHPHKLVVISQSPLNQSK